MKTCIGCLKQQLSFFEKSEDNMEAHFMQMVSGLASVANLQNCLSGIKRAKGFLKL